MDFRKIVDVPWWSLAPGVRVRVMMSGERIMLFLVDIEAGASVPKHSHPNEQMGICLKGKAIFRGDGEERVIEEGSTYWFVPDEEHSIEALEESRLLDVFSPPRQNHLEKQKQHTTRS